MQLKAKVDVSTISPCEHQLHLRKVQISGPQEAELMKQQLEQHSTKFSQDNGRIESVCFDEQEATWVANLKRAVLSTIQVSVREETEQIVEKDVLGYCNTQYEQISANTLKKTKFLNTCTKRSQSVSSKFFRVLLFDLSWMFAFHDFRWKFSANSSSFPLPSPTHRSTRS